jgi:hypothetical protein
MISLGRMRYVAVWVSFGTILVAILSGCGTPGAPQPPSLNLPATVRDLSATRAGREVRLNWTMPKRNTDRTMIKGDVPVRVCRRESDAAVCDPAGPEKMTAPGAAAEYTDTLPDALASGAARPISYFVELRNSKGRSAGLSNAAVVLSGAAPAKIDGFQAEVQKQGVLLSWAKDDESTAVRLDRKLLAPARKADHGPLSSAPEPQSQSLLVEAGKQPRAIDKTVRFGESYEYRAQRVVRVNIGGDTLELNGEYSAPVRVDVQDVFPPAVPGGLVAVATQGDNGSGPAIDLSWQPDPDADVAGYIVYRREEGGSWQRISAAAPVVGPAFHDPGVKAGHTYDYAVTAVDKSGHESARSVEAHETVPQQ